LLVFLNGLIFRIKSMYFAHANFRLISLLSFGTNRTAKKTLSSAHCKLKLILLLSLIAYSERNFFDTHYKSSLNTWMMKRE
jgi:hypothetical protein